MSDIREALMAEGEGGEAFDGKDDDEEEDIDYEVGEEEEEEEEEDDVEDGGYTFRFDGGVDPLDFVEGDGTAEGGLQLYERLERLEHEQRKRKALDELRQCDESVKKPRQEDFFGASMDEIMEAMELRSHRRRSGKLKKRGRRTGSRNKLNPEITRMLRDATLHYASGLYDEAIRLLKDVVQLAPNLAETYHTLGFVHNAKGDRKRALNYCMIAALRSTTKDPSLWKLLVTWSIEQGNIRQARWCLTKAITADPKDLTLRFNLAKLYFELGDYQKAAKTYDQIIGICPANVNARKMAAKMHRTYGQIDRAIGILEDYVKVHASEADLGVVDLLAEMLMKNKEHLKALQHIEYAGSVICSGKDLPSYLTVKAGMCHACLGNHEEAQLHFRDLRVENAGRDGKRITEVADLFFELGHFDYALKYYFMLEAANIHENGNVHLKIAQCYLSSKEHAKATPYFYKALSKMENSVDVRLTLCSLLIEEKKEDEAISLLSAPKDLDRNSWGPKPFWLCGIIRMRLAQIYHSKGMLENFVDAILSPVRETLFIETRNQKVRTKKRLTRSVLIERSKLLDDHQDDDVFVGFTPIAHPSDKVRAYRAKKSLKKIEAIKEEKKAAALAAGHTWHSDESEDEKSEALWEPPLPKLLKDEEHYQLILALCKALASLKRYWEALEIINHCLKFVSNTIPVEKEELRSLGAQIAYKTTDPKHGYDCARYMVQQRPYSVAAWNCYYKVVSRLVGKYGKHAKFLNAVRNKYPDCVPPMIINGHQFSMISQHQTAAREYLEAYKAQPDNPLISLCAGTSLINLALGFRVQNKNLCMVQGFAFLYNYLRICNNSQEALYNVGRACQHVGLVTLAVSYYKKVLAIHEKDYPMPKLPNEDSMSSNIHNVGYCNLNREAAYNLHLIYKKSGAVDLARQVLKDNCTF